MDRTTEAGCPRAQRPSSEPSWAIEQARYLMSETMDRTLEQRPDADPMRVEVARALSTLAERILAEGSRVDALSASQAAVGHLRRAHQVDDRVSDDLARALYNLSIVLLAGEETEGRADAGRHASAALRVVLARSGSPDSDVELLVPLALMTTEIAVDLIDSVELIDSRGVADLTAAAGRCAQSPAATPEALRALGFALTSLASGLAQRERTVDSFDVSIAASILYRTLATREPGRYGPDLATALKNCAVLSERLGRRREAAEHARGASDWYGRSSERGGPQEDAQAAMLLLEARSWLAAGSYADAARPAREAQVLYRRLAEREPDRYLGAHHTAASLLQLATGGAN